MELIYSFKVTVLEVFQYSDFIVYIVSWAGMTEFLRCPVNEIEGSLKGRVTGWSVGFNRCNPDP